MPALSTRLRMVRPVEVWRGGLFNSIDAALSRAQRAKREKLMGQNGLFGGMPEEIDYANELSPTAKGWTSSEMLAAEKAALGFYITGHPARAVFGDAAKSEGGAVDRTA